MSSTGIHKVVIVKYKLQDTTLLSRVPVPEPKPELEPEPKLLPHPQLGMARGIPRPSILEVPDLFSLLDSPRNRFHHSSDPRVLDQNSSRTPKMNYVIITLLHFKYNITSASMKSNLKYHIDLIH